MTTESRVCNPLGEDVKSPCIGVCSMDSATGLCIGCHRTLNEIARWSCAPAEEQKKILSAIEMRKKVC